MSAFGLFPSRGGHGAGWRRSICPYCGTGCGLLIRARDGVVRDVRGDPDHPVNRGRLCAKGALLAPTLDAPDRLRWPMARAHRNAPLRQISWDDAIARLAGAIRDAQAAWGPDAVMLYGSGQLPTEDYYLWGKLAKGFLRTPNQDTNSRLCMASAVAAYRLALGEDAPPCSYADIEAARTFLIVGANPEACHPILFQRIKARRKAEPSVRVIVIDPRRTRTADLADLHLAPRPGTDVALINALLYECLLAGGADHAFIRDHTEAWDTLAPRLPGYQAERAHELTGVPAQAIVDAARIYAHNGPALTLWSMGANQSVHGVDKNLALINLSLATGNIGKAGAGPFSLTGQPNAMGGREAGGLAGALPGHRSTADASDRAEVEHAWGIPPGTIPSRPGLTAVEMVEALEDGRIKVVWIAGTNPLFSLPNAARVREALARADLVAVQDAYHPTETTEVADIVLPAAQWSERAGTMTNSERRICLLEAAASPPGEALPDWRIICRVADALGYGDAFAYPSEEAIFREYRDLTAGRDLDITGVSYDVLRARPQGVTWPFPAGAKHDTPRLYEDLRFPTPSGRARFHVVDHAAPADPVDDAFPFVLLTGRVKDQWHSRTRTGRIAKLTKRDGAPFLELHPDDARSLRVRNGDLLRITSRRGAFRAPARVTDAILPGTVFAPFHWAARWAADSSPNLAASEDIDARSKEPELKYAAVRLEPA